MGKRLDIIKILIFVFAGLIALLVIVGSAILITESKKLKAIELSPDFAQTELEVGSQYTFSLNTKPAKASVKKLRCIADDPLCTFEANDDGKVILTTGLSEGTVTIYVESKDIKSQVLTYAVIDSVARAQAEAEAAAAAEAQAAAEAEAAAMEAEIIENTKVYVKCIGDDVRVRSSNSTDSNDNILGKAKNGEVFEKVEDVEDWTHLIFQGQDGYMKTEFLQEISEEEAMSALNGAAEGEENAEQTAEEEKKPEEKKQEQTAEQTTQTKEEAEAKAAADAAKAAADAQAAALAEAQAAAEAAAAAQAAAAALGTKIYCKDGVCLVTPDQLNKIHATWDFAGDAVEMAGHHSISELEAVIGPVTRL